MGEVVERTDRAQDAEVLGRRALEQHRDAAALESLHDRSERLGAGGVEHLELREPQDHHPDVGHGGELGEEPLRGAEEQGAVEPVGDDVLGEQRLLLVVVTPSPGSR